MIDVQRGTIAEEHTCAGCGRHGSVALIAYPDAEHRPLALCRACARDRATLTRLLRVLGVAPPAPTLAPPPPR